MRNIYIFLTISIILTALFSCATQEPLETEVIPPEKIVQESTITPEVVEKVEEKPSNTLNESEIQKAETDISELIQELNELIASKNFNEWKNYLSADYIEYYSDPDVLKEKSQSPLLTKYKIVLRSLEDYFNYVVVGSRQNVQLDEIKALDRDRIKAYMFINNKAVIIYELIRIDNNWKIGKFLE
ncbi:MAG: hypothetical protein KAQ93_01115 [Spirochaetales bacterium]|nr:hypothetical protein [Spirochaetales bacterium]